MKKVSQILSRKGTHVVSVDGSTTVLDTLKLMAEKNIGSVVITENGEYAGLFTERDYARKVILMGKLSSETSVSEIMSTDLPHIAPDYSIEVCMHILGDKNLRYLPVFDKSGKFCAIISIGDIVNETIHTQKELIEQLHSYIQS
jgi:CBS domain-containing protein